FGHGANGLPFRIQGTTSTPIFLPDVAGGLGGGLPVPTQGGQGLGSLLGGLLAERKNSSGERVPKKRPRVSHDEFPYLHRDHKARGVHHRRNRLYGRSIDRGAASTGARGPRTHARRLRGKASTRLPSGHRQRARKGVLRGAGTSRRYFCATGWC